MKFGIISDIHEDIVSLEKALVHIEKTGCDEIICLGDIIGFSIPSFAYYEDRNASKCIDIVRQNCKYIVAGNHDLYPAHIIPEFNAGFNYPENWYDLDYSERKTLAGEEVWLNEENELNPLISKKDQAFLKQLPEFLVVKTSDINLFLSHYLYPDLSGSHRQYYENFGPQEPHLDFINSNNALIGFSGHKHIEGFYKKDSVNSENYEFGSYELKKELQWIVGPCIANGKNKNGFMIFDTESFTLDVIPLNSPPRMMDVVYI